MSVGGSVRRRRLLAAAAVTGSAEIPEEEEEQEASPLTELSVSIMREPVDEVSHKTLKDKPPF